jgi:hypothetical protein
MISSDHHLDETQIRFQKAFGARHFRQGKPRAILELKSPSIPTAMYEARLRGLDQAEGAKENAPGREEGRKPRDVKKGMADADLHLHRLDSIAWSAARGKRWPQIETRRSERRVVDHYR